MINHAYDPEGDGFATRSLRAFVLAVIDRALVPSNAGSLRFNHSVDLPGIRVWMCARSRSGPAAAVHVHAAADVRSDPFHGLVYGAPQRRAQVPDGLGAAPLPVGARDGVRKTILKDNYMIYLF